MTYHFDHLQDFPYWTFDDAVATATDEFPREWKRFWGIGTPTCPDHLDPDAWEQANEMHDVARRIAHAASALQSKGVPEALRTLPPVLRSDAESEKAGRRELAEHLEQSLTPEQRESDAWKDVVYFLRWREGEAEARAKLFQTAVEIYAHPAFGSTPRVIASRLLDLLEFLMRTSGERAREYLQRVAACYIRGMDPELAVMSRAVMEAALHIDAIEVRLDANLRVKGRLRQHPGLGDWIQAAVDVKALDQPGRKAAELVKDAGDDAVHMAPQQIPDSRTILHSLRRVLVQLERFTKRPG